MKKDKVLSVEGLTDGSRIVANRSTLKHHQGALLSPQEKEKNTLQAVDGKSGLFSKERTLFFKKILNSYFFFSPKALYCYFLTVGKLLYGFCHITMRISHNYMYGGAVNH